MIMKFIHLSIAAFALVACGEAPGGAGNDAEGAAPNGVAELAGAKSAPSKEKKKAVVHDVAMSGMTAGRTGALTEAVKPGTPVLKQRVVLGEDFSRFGPLIADDVLIVTDHDKHLDAFNVVAGEKIWSQNLEERVAGSPAMAEGMFFYTRLKDDRLRALDLKTGEEVWSFVFPEETPKQLAELSAPVIYSDGIVFAVTSARSGYQAPGRLYAIDVRTGEEIWRREEPTGVVVPSAGSGYVAYTGGDLLRVVDAATGEVKWGLEGGETYGKPVVIGDALYIGHESLRSRFPRSFVGNLAAFDLATGEVRWALPLRSGWGAKLFGRDGLIYYVDPQVSRDYKRIDPATGAALSTRMLDDVNCLVLDADDNLLYTVRSRSKYGVAAVKPGETPETDELLFDVGGRRQDAIFGCPVIRKGVMYGFADAGEDMVHLVGYAWE